MEDLILDLIFVVIGIAIAIGGYFGFKYGHSISTKAEEIEKVVKQ